MGETSVTISRQTRRFLVVCLALCFLFAAARLDIPTTAYAEANTYDWTKQSSLDLLGGSYTSVASSANGSHLAVATTGGGGSNPTPLYVSNNYGASWQNVAASADSGIQDSWQSVAESEDGQTVVAASDSGTNISTTAGVNGKILISHDAGSTWTNISPVGATQWEAVAISGDGNKIVAVANDDLNHVYISNNGGNSWTTSATTNAVQFWYSLQISENGNKVLVGGENTSNLNSLIDVSTDGGTDWTDVTPDPAGDGAIVTLVKAALSSNGNEIAEATYGYNGSNWYDAVKVSSDNGTNWTDVTPDNSNLDQWTAIGLSGNGTTLSVLNNSNDTMFTSSNDGTSWSQEDPDQAYSDADTNAWNSIAISENGTHSIVASTANTYTGYDASREANVVTFANAGDGKGIQLITPSGTNVTCNSTVSESSLAAQDAGYSYPLGLVDFCLNEVQGSNQITLIFETNLTPGQVVLRDYNTTTKQYTTVTGATITETTLNGQPALRVTYSLPDNSILDTDPTFGSISDPVGLAVATAAPNTGLGTPSNRSLGIATVLSTVSLAAGLVISQVRRKVKL